MHRTRHVRTECAWLAGIALLAAVAVPAAADSTGPLGGYSGGTFQDVKSPELEDSDTFATTWGMHITSSFGNYAGFLFVLRYDGHEVSYANLSPAGMHTHLEGPGGGLVSTLRVEGSQSTTQIVSPIVAWISPSNAADSGTWVSTSLPMPLFAVSGQAKNTTAQFNSDVDITLSAWQIHHKAALGSLALLSGNWVYETHGGAEFSSIPGGGTWVQLTTSHYWAQVPTSVFYATHAFITSTSGYGIEHVPEPVSVLLMISGMAASLMGRQRRRSCR